MERKPRTGLAIGFILLAFAGLVTYALVASPPQKIQEHSHEEEEQPRIISGRLGQIDPANAKRITVKVERLDEKCANEIAQALSALGCIGELSADLGAKIFKIEYDSTKTSENQILQAFASVDHPGQIVAE